MSAPICPDHGEMKARQGKFGAFWSCGVKMPDGSWCPFKPPRTVAAPTVTQTNTTKFERDMDGMTRSQENDKRDKSIKWMNAKNNATAIVVALLEQGHYKDSAVIQQIILNEIQEWTTLINDIEDTRTE